MLGPLISSSPIAARGTSLPSSSTMRIAVCISALPAEPTLRIASAASSMVPAGLVSVMPQPWTSGTPRAAQAFEDGQRTGRAADAGDPQAREVGALELRDAAS